MRQTNLNLLLAILFAFGITQAVAQRGRPIKFGKPLPEELKMSVYQGDTTAHAVVLYDQGHFNSVNFNFTRHIRLKILKKSGTSYGNFDVSTPQKSSIEGYTYNLENGMVVERKLSRENIFEEEIVENVKHYKIFFPDVREGSVIDLRYYHPGIPFEWRFQERIPVVYNELILEPVEAISFKKNHVWIY